MELSRYQAQRGDRFAYTSIEESLEFVLAQKLAESADEKSVRLVFAPLNFKAFALIRPLPHALWLGRYPVRSAGFAAQRGAYLVGAAQHAVIARL